MTASAGVQTRRSWAERLFALVLGLAFLSSTGGDAFGYHSCPHHDGIGLHAVASAVDGYEAMHSGHAARDVAENGPAAEGHDSGEPCSCLGHCNAPDAAADLTVSPATAALPALDHESHEPRSFAPPVKRNGAYLLPPATAPPSSC